jgi:TRAP-type C4-dicarboxylate transport system substrate-binding protein
MTSSAATVVAALLMAAGCGGSTSDKAGGTHDKPVVLTMANPSLSPTELEAFSSEVTKRSGGTLRVRFANNWRHGERDSETGLIHDVKAGRVDMGWVGSRAWDAVGVTSFDALHAPFLVDSYALEQAVLQSQIPDRMLKGIKPVGLVGLGILPGPLRRPLAAPRALRTPADYAGLRIGYQGARGPAETLRALGAKPIQLVAGAKWHDIDGIEQQLASINSDNYDDSAHYLTANVALWPRSLVVFANARAYAGLTPKQRAALATAAHQVVGRTLDSDRTQDRSALTELCRRGITLALATPADIAHLRAAVASVLARLRRVGDTRAVIAAIARLRAQAAPAGEPALRCLNSSQSSASGLPEGDYTTTIAPDDAAREIANVPRQQRAEAGLSPGGVRDILHSHFTLSLRHGAFVLYQVHADGHREVGIQGSYSLFRDRFVGNGSNGDTLRARWSFDGTNLRFSDFNVPGAYRLVWASEPWTRSN